jgi:hypothetical protein
MAVTGKDEFGNDLLESRGLMGTDFGKEGGVLTALLDAAAKSMPGLGTFYNAAASENKYDSSAGQYGNQYALDNLLPGALGKVPGLADLLKIGKAPAQSLGSFWSTQTPKLIDEQKVQSDWLNQTARDAEKIQKSEEGKTGNALYMGNEALDTALEMATLNGAQTPEQQQALAMYEELKESEKLLSKFSSQISEADKAVARLKNRKLRWEIAKLYFGVDENGAVRMPQFPKNAGLGSGLGLSIPSQFDNAMAGARGYDEEALRLQSMDNRKAIVDYSQGVR